VGLIHIPAHIRHATLHGVECDVVEAGLAPSPVVVNGILIFRNRVISRIIRVISRVIGL
jgi:hypothetical protein